MKAKLHAVQIESRMGDGGCKFIVFRFGGERRDDMAGARVLIAHGTPSAHRSPSKSRWA